MFCTWLVAFCNVYDGNTTDHVPLPFKLPYIEMFEDIKEGIIENDFSPLAIQEFFDTTSQILMRECRNCNSEEIRRAAYAAKAGLKNIKDMNLHIYTDYEDVKNSLINETELILKSLQAIPNTTLAFVDKFSYNSFYSRKVLRVNKSIRFCNNINNH